MDVKRFFAPSAAEVLRAMREELGADAVVLATWVVDGGVELLAEPARCQEFGVASAAPASRPARETMPGLPGEAFADPNLAALLAGSRRGD